MRFGSICSGIEAASVAWEPLGWQAQWLAEIEPFPSAVLAHRWPRAENLGDFTRISNEALRDKPIDLLVGGTPCTSFSPAGLREGLGAHSGNLALEFFRLAGRTRPRWVLWENSFGVLQTDSGRDFGALLGALAELGYGWAYRILDAQYFGLAQRRRRVFVVGCAGGGWRAAAAVFLEREGMRGDSPPSRESREGSASTTQGSARKSDAPIPFDLTQLTHPENRSKPLPGAPAPTLPAQGRGIHVAVFNVQPGFNSHNTLEAKATEIAEALTAVGPSRRSDRGDVVVAVGGDIAHTLRAEGCDASEDGTGRGTPIVAVASTLTAHHGRNAGEDNFVAGAQRVRRLTPRECERLQGFPDDYTLIPWRKGLAPDSLRYRAIGNSMAVPVMRWIGRRIQLVEEVVGESGCA